MNEDELKSKTKGIQKIKSSTAMNEILPPKKS